MGPGDSLADAELVFSELLLVEVSGGSTSISAELSRDASPFRTNPSWN